MKHPIRLIAACAVTLILSSCLQNAKDSILIVENNTAGDIRFDIRGDVLNLAAGVVDTIDKMESTNYDYSILISNIPAIIGNVTLTKASMNPLNQSISFDQRGVKIRLNVQSTLSNVVADTTAPTGFEGSYVVDVFKTIGWADDF